jgi:DNA-binding protein Fis
LEICGGNRTLAAHHLGITRQTLAKKVGSGEAGGEE